MEIPALRVVIVSFTGKGNLSFAGAYEVFEITLEIDGGLLSASEESKV